VSEVDASVGVTEQVPASYAGGTVPTYHAARLSTALGIVRPTVTPLAGPPVPEEDPVLTWLRTEEARGYQHHWVALSPDTGRFLGLADNPGDVRRWESRGAVVVYVDLPEPGSWSSD
jgi:hypothetical protein